MGAYKELEKIPGFLNFLKEEKAHYEQVWEFNAFLERNPNFTKEYLEAFLMLKSIYLKVNNQLVIQHMRNSRVLAERRNGKSFKFKENVLLGVISRWAVFVFGEEHGVNFKFLPLTYEGLGGLRYKQAEAMGKLEFPGYKRGEIK